MIDLDFSFFIQWINFLILLVFLNHFLFKPVLEVVERRNKRLSSLNADVSRFSEKSESAIQQYEKLHGEMKKESSSILQSARQESIAEQENILQKARGEFTEKVESARKEIAGEVQEANKNLGKEAGKISMEIAAKLLGRSAK